jgi:hypothetical protein
MYFILCRRHSEVMLDMYVILVGGLKQVPARLLLVVKMAQSAEEVRLHSRIRTFSHAINFLEPLAQTIHPLQK